MQNISAEDIGVGQPVVRGHAQPAADTSDQCGKRKRSPSPLLWDTITEFDTAPEGDVHNTWLPPHAHAVIPREPLASAVGGCEARNQYSHASCTANPALHTCAFVKAHALCCVGVWLHPPTFLRTPFCVHQRSKSHICTRALRLHKDCAPPPTPPNGGVVSDPCFVGLE